MDEDRYRNQRGLLDVESFQYLDIAIVGVGSIGSFLALALNKLGFHNLILIDNDRVEDHNVTTQLYSQDDVGEYKVLALEKYLTGNITSYVGLVTASNNINADVVFVCVDSLKQRYEILKCLKRSYSKHGLPKLMIDGRMHRLVFNIFTILFDKKDMVDMYKESTQQEEFSGSCTEKGIIQNIYMLTSIMVEQLRKALDGLDFFNTIYADMERLKFISTNAVVTKPKKKPKKKAKPKAKPTPKKKVGRPLKVVEPVEIKPIIPEETHWEPLESIENEEYVV